MRQLLIATRNKNKFLEIKRALQGLPFEFLSLNETKISQDFKVKETGKGFLENAVLKARSYGQKSGLLTLADDSGLEVEALGGRPGVHSNRYVVGSDEDRYQKLLQEMKNIPEGKRKARFYCLVAIFDPQTKKLMTTKGVCQGKITQEPKGNYGFGYDPVFYLPDHQKTMAQLRPEEKLIASHRGKALQKAKRLLSVRLLEI